MIGEYDNSGNVISEYFYFGLRPVAVKTNGVLHIVHTDYLGTPRIITRLNGGSVVWQWKNDNPYGNNKAQGSIEFNLRFAGQYYDSESGLHYNMNRTYNPETGRYLQSDPLGLSAGFNTYNYVNKNPLDSVDPDGLILVPMLHPQTTWLRLLEIYANGFESAFKIIGNRDSDVINILGHGNGDSINHTSPEQMAQEIISGYYDIGERTDFHKKNNTFTNDIYINNKFKENLLLGKNVHIILNACDTGTGYGYAYKMYGILREYMDNNGYKNVKLQIDAPTDLTKWKYWTLSQKPLEDTMSTEEWRTYGEKFE